MTFNINRLLFFTAYTEGATEMSWCVRACTHARTHARTYTATHTPGHLYSAAVDHNESVLAEL